MFNPAVGDGVYVAGIAGMEVGLAFTRQRHHGNLPAPDFIRVLAQFHQDFEPQDRIIDLTAPLIARAMVLAEMHVLRGYDAVPCAAALELHISRRASSMSRLAFVPADDALKSAATAEGLLVENPNSQL